MPAQGIETGRRHLEDTSLAREFIPAVRDKEGNVLIYDLAPTPQTTGVQRRGLVTHIKLAASSLFAGIGH
ncbi:MAG: hypothetical protein A2186_03465 [Candidatus Levybacteria bacterium RIFOXYA1_FULL_41_10]|nr:MAG: hypothetical protein UT87_C0009G0016 [Candidatus Levybacteria bacterium GW2011_GWC1_40_19]KKR95114.1 MAG: hypothetical protein UU45_C0004G0017 [Candidatus Levybacteria bacterium GW2011_GWA2_41_15]KKS01145.1 MAG: hypothetical protein UU52_C0018G0013 [Candidatus Levybacteria bacterium GW2011_GWB1_41_21]OGH20943.1 MAG: hypothetical protein A2695_03005 [Candidatus Levybacteria bacterium RIFCSPHIGHO2_01_FULL_40_83]OGH27704.1 MAG: hypothetical protein A3D82_04580 [Candidatus Levybacteria bact